MSQTAPFPVTTTNTYFIDHTHSRRKNGTTSSLLDSTREWLLWCHVTRLLVKFKLVIIYEVVLFRYLWMTATIFRRRSKILLGENWNSKLTKSRDMIATLISMEWISLETMVAKWLRNGIHSSNHSFKLKQLMAILLECLLLLSLKRLQIKLKQHAMLKHPRRSSSDRKWWRSWPPLSKSHRSRISSMSCTYFLHAICFDFHVFSSIY